MIESKFFDLENIDGYFSGIISIPIDGKQYVLEFGFDIEFETLMIKQCMNPLYSNEFNILYSEDEMKLSSWMKCVFRRCKESGEIFINIEGEYYEEDNHYR